MIFLIVDDNPKWRKYLAQVLSSHTCQECPDGSGVISAFEKYRPDWVLMDIEMPGIDGLSAARALRARHPSARIAILSQYSAPELVEQAKASKVQHYIRKDELWRLDELAAPGS